MTKVKILCVIPARYNSKRFPGKVLVDICGKPMLQHVWEKCLKSKLVDKVIVATDSRRVYDFCKKIGAEVVMTSSRCRNGTERVCEAALKYKPEIVTNVQCDEPLITADVIDKTVKALLKEKGGVSVSTAVVKSDDDINDKSLVKVVFDKDSYALYFSRSPIPANKVNKFFKHIGIYVYKFSFLKKIVNLPRSALEILEDLEQLRILENGYKIKVVPIEGSEIVSVDTPKDLLKVKKILERH